MNCIQLANTIKGLCEEKNVSVSKMLSDCGIQKGLIYDLEKRSKIPSCETIEKIADYFNESIDNLLGRMRTYDIIQKEIINISNSKSYNNYVLCKFFTDKLNEQNLNIVIKNNVTHIIPYDVFNGIKNGTYLFTDDAINFFCELFDVKKEDLLKNQFSVDETKENNIKSVDGYRLVAEEKISERPIVKNKPRTTLPEKN